MSRALILVGGYGTRLRPLTLSIPKPIVEFCNKKMILHQIEALVKAGVKKIVLAVAYKPELMSDALAPDLAKLDVEVVYSHEKTPLGTAGPLALAKEHLKSEANEPFFVLNADVTANYDFAALAAFHRNHGKEGTIMVTKVEEPSRYGVVVYDTTSGKIDRFVEKPPVFVGNRINAGIYMFNSSLLDRIEAKPTSIEREVFPEMAESGNLFAMDLQGHWMDVGQPPDYLVGMGLNMGHMLAINHPDLYQAKDTDEFGVIQPVIIDPSAQIGKGSLIGPNVVCGPDSKIGAGVRLNLTSVMRGVVVGDNSWIKNSILGWESTIGKWTRIENVSVLGEDVTIRDELYINGGKILPHKEIKASIEVPAVIL